ncbi:hypothetical protein QEW_2245 [Clostridioides difficile CD160]|nr:hypothetical protein QEW_2245 [Clostridioides difficile CD160]
MGIKILYKNIDIIILSNDKICKIKSERKYKNDKTINIS